MTTSLERHTLFTVLGTIVFAVSVPLAVWTGGACASSASLRRAARSAWSAVLTLANA